MISRCPSRGALFFFGFGSWLHREGRGKVACVFVRFFVCFLCLVFASNILLYNTSIHSSRHRFYSTMLNEAHEILTYSNRLLF